MARLPHRGAPDPITDRYEAELVERVAESFWLPSEQVLHAGLGQHEATGERYGRGQGEGLFYLTTHRFIFWFSSNPRGSEFMAIPKDQVQQVKDEWIVIPGMRALSLSMGRHVSGLTNSQGKARFYVDRPLSGIVERDWEVTEPFRQPGPGVAYPDN